MLNAKQSQFISEYLIDLNATQAAIRAGYSPKTAYSQGERLLRNVEIKTAIDARLLELDRANVATAQEVEEYLTRVMRGESTAEVVVIEGQGEGVSYARRMDKAPDERERLKAAELLAKRHGLLTDKVKVDGIIPLVIRDDVPEGGDE
jgi:phage terminase small subunit